MPVKEKIEKVKRKAARLAIKAATVATLISGTGAFTSCSEANRNTNENGEKIEKTGGTKTSVVFRTKQQNNKNGSFSKILLENGDVLHSSISPTEDGTFLEVGDTVTYKGNDIKAIRYKDGAGKQVNFGKIGKMENER